MNLHVDEMWVMISLLTYNNLHKYGVAFSSQFRLRHRSFKERQKYDVRSYNGMEYDQYDTPATIYLVYQSPVSGEALGMSRLTPITQCCMVQDLWPELVDNKEALRSYNTWESTRFCVERDLSAEIRRKISNELVLAHVEMGLLMGIEKITGVMPSLIFHSVFKKAGCSFEFLGKSIRVDGLKIQAAWLDVSERQLSQIRNVSGVESSVLVIEGEENAKIKRAA